MKENTKIYKNIDFKAAYKINSWLSKMKFENDITVVDIYFNSIGMTDDYFIQTKTVGTDTDLEEAFEQIIKAKEIIRSLEFKLEIKSKEFFE